jgi:hypothetical protein
MGDVIRLLDSGLYGCRICGPEGSGEPIVTADCVSFNGDAEARTQGPWGRDDLSHESFDLPRTLDPADYRGKPRRGRYFQFCKTARKPYDVLVTAALVRLAHRFPAWPIRSDGDPADWRPGMDLCRAVFGAAELPEGVRLGPCAGLLHPCCHEATHAVYIHPRRVEMCDGCHADHMAAIRSRTA